jgi:hypothetical protein
VYRVHQCPPNIDGASKCFDGAEKNGAEKQMHQTLTAPANASTVLKRMALKSKCIKCDGTEKKAKTSHGSAVEGL